MAEISGNKITWDASDWTPGVIPQSFNNGPQTLGRGASFESAVNPFRRLGSICPGFLPVDLDTGSIVSSVIKSADTDYSGTTPFAYLVGGSLLHRLDLSTDIFSTTVGFPRTINDGHASMNGQDVKIYNIVSGASSTTSTMVLYSYTDATDGNVGAYDIAAGVFYDTFLSTQPTGASALTPTDPHPMILGDDGSIYIGNSRSLLKLNGETGGNGNLETKLTFPRGTVIRSFTKSPDYLIIYASRSNQVSNSFFRGTSTAYFWDYNSQNFNFAYDLSDNLVTSGFNWNGIIGCFTNGRVSEGGSTCTKIKLFNGNKFEQVEEYNGNPPGHGGVEIHDGMIAWVFGDNVQSAIATYGSPWGSRVKSGLHFWAQPTGTSLTTTGGGVCLNLGGTKLYVSSGTTTTGGLQTFSSAFASSALFQAPLVAPNFPEGMRGKITSVKVHFYSTATAGRTLTLQFNCDAVLTTGVVITAGGTFASTTLQFKKDINNKEFPYFHSVRPNLSWAAGTDSSDAPSVSKIELFFKTTSFVQA